MKSRSQPRRTARLEFAAAVAGVVVASGVHAQAVPAAEALAQDSWREAIHQLAVPHHGCFTAAYPVRAWAEAACIAAPDKMYLPRSGVAETVGNGNDYAATTANLTQSAVGSFPVVTGVTSEKDGLKNIYSIQLNSNFMPGTAACAGHSGCMSWLQFVYSSGEKSAFMQYWLINYGASCPSGWSSASGSCWKNGAAVAVPRLAIGTLSQQKMSGTAVNGGLDTLVFTTPTRAYSTTGGDSAADLGTAWKQSEFNIIGDGGGSKASFNKGSSLTVKIAVTDGSSNAPGCASNAGTTGETNNLTLGACASVGGAAPYVQFVQSN